MGKGTSSCRMLSLRTEDTKKANLLSRDADMVLSSKVDHLNTFMKRDFLCLIFNNYVNKMIL